MPTGPQDHAPYGQPRRNLRAGLLGEPLAGGLSRDDERDPDFAPRPIVGRARATISRTRASPARTLSTASASMHRSVVSSIGTLDGSNSSASFAARWSSSSVCMTFGSAIEGVGIEGGRAPLTRSAAPSAGGPRFSWRWSTVHGIAGQTTAQTARRGIG